MRDIISLNNFSDLAGVSRATVEAWAKTGKVTVHQDMGLKYLRTGELMDFLK